MDEKLLFQVRKFAEQMKKIRGYEHVEEVVGNCWILSRNYPVDEEVLLIAAYLHDISSVEQGPEGHWVRSGEVAAKFLREHGYSEEKTQKVVEAIKAHNYPAQGVERDKVPLEGKILYDADKLVRVNGLEVVASLIDFGRDHPLESLTREEMSIELREVRSQMMWLYESLYTIEAKEMAKEGYGRTLSFLESVISLTE